MVGNNTNNYSLGISAYIKGVFPVSQTGDLTLGWVQIFFLNDGGSRDGTALVPIKAGYRYSLNGAGRGFIFGPQIGL